MMNANAEKSAKFTGNVSILGIDSGMLRLEERKVFDKLSHILHMDYDKLDGIRIRTDKTHDGSLKVALEGEDLVISYPSILGFARGLAHVREVWETGKSIEERMRVDDCGLMLDVSRNAVLAVESVKLMLNYMASMGLNCLMLYTEDTYEVPEYPYFGYQRGAYTATELKEIDDYAFSLGIEVIPCIQTLAHLATTLRWPYANKFKDTHDILKVGEDETYKFIRSMFATLRSVLRSKRIHVGMDEAADLGRGRYLDQNGYRPAYQIMQEHLEKVVELAKEFDYTPMIWSDMYYRMASPTHDYYDLEHPLTEAILDSISPEVGLVYWDYYHYDQETYDVMLVSHMATKSCEIWFAGGIQTWNGVKSSMGKTFGTTEPALQSCIKNGVRHVITTAWGDNGAEVSIFEALLGLQYYGEFAWREELPTREECIALFTNRLGINGEAYYNMRLFDEVPGVDKDNPRTFNPSKYTLWCDPLLGTYDAHIIPMGETLIDHYQELAEYFDACANDSDDQSRLFYLQSAQLADVLMRKIRLILDLRPAYLNDDREVLQQVVRKDIPDLIGAVTDLQAFTLSIWYLFNKPEGSEVIDIRFGAQLARLKTCQDRVDGLLNGVYESLPELEAERLPITGRSLAETEENPHTHCNIWTQIVSANPV